ncbi:MAG: membrane protein insertion efficiency factor YidD [Candidatus Aminicenantes bacterium]|nr:membrane protein insertion efficiency factor YidD [Candidatus Aminicenantes bacterium]
MKRVLLFLIRVYKRIVSPFLGTHCRFYPTCSEYMYQAVEKYGLGKGFRLGLKRLLRCHPFHEGGLDPVR